MTTPRKLTELNPRFIGAGGDGITGPNGEPVPARHGVGVMLDCPCGAVDSPLYVPFANPLDGGPQYGPQGWQRTGESFDTLTLTPSILRTFSHCGCRWHGYITAGEVRAA